MKRHGRNKNVRILGIDPGSIKCGFGLIDIRGKDALYITSGTISPPHSKPLHERLSYIYDSLLEIIHSYHPDEIVVERIFFAKSSKAALSLGHARGVVLLTAASEKIRLHECSALEVKKATVGYGRADKRQVQEMVRLMLNIKDTLSPDSADALALALCYSNTIEFNETLRKSSGER